MVFAMLEAVSASPPPQHRAASRHTRAEITKRQAIIIVSTAATIFILWPERFIILRNLCLVPLLAWFTALVFDAKDAVDGAWNGVPAWIKRMIVGDAGAPAKVNPQKASRQGADSRETWEDAIREIVKLVLFLSQKVANTLKRSLKQVSSWLPDFGQLLNSPETVSEPSKPATAKPPKACEYYGILVRSPSVHDYGSIQPGLAMREQVAKAAIDWESHNSASIPPMIGSLSFRTHLSFCLVEKDVWDSQSLTLLNKLVSGTYWDITEERKGSGKRRTRQQVREFDGIEILGLVDGKYDALEKCDEYFDSLKEDWEYLKISWNDVDFAIILGLLVTGKRAKGKSVELFRTFDQLRMDQVLRLRAEAGPRFSHASFSIAAVSIMATVATAGLATPFTLPLMAGSAMTSIGSAVAESQISERDRRMLEKRREACKNLELRFPQLEGLFEKREDEEDQAEDEENDDEPVLWESALWDVFD